MKFFKKFNKKRRYYEWSVSYNDLVDRLRMEQKEWERDTGMTGGTRGVASLREDESFIDIFDPS